METYYLIHYRITYGTDTITDCTTVRSSNGGSAESAVETLINSFRKVDAKLADKIEVLAVKPFTQEQYNQYLSLIRVE